jgi:hypothetical protein
LNIVREKILHFIDKRMYYSLNSITVVKKTRLRED